jgi:hypothetical protein
VEPAGDDEARNDNGVVEIGPGLIAGIRRERLEMAARVLARRFVDRAMREMEAATRGNG